MCIIVDNCVAWTLTAIPPNEDGSPVLQFLLEGRGALVSGGRLEEELIKNERLRRLLIRLRQAGKLVFPPVRQLELKAEELSTSGLCRSNDPHVLAVALVSGARLVYTRDNDLIADFHDKRIVDKPRGKVYMSARNAALLRARDVAHRCGT